MSKIIEVPFGKVEIISETPEFQTAVIHIASGKDVPAHIHKKTIEFEYVLEGELVCNNKLIEKGSSKTWKINEPHHYENKSNKPARLLCISVPPWTPEDEIRIEEK